MEGKVLLALSVSVLIIVLSKLKSRLVAKPKPNLPPGPWTLPVIGSLHHFIAGGLPHHAMRRLAIKYGPVMMLRLGEVPALVLSSPEAAEEALKTQDLAFADRNVNPTLKELAFDGNDVALAPYGERWRQLRKICVTELLTQSRVQSFQRIREQEVARFLHDVAASAAAGAAVDLSRMVSKLINDTLVLETVGNRCKYHHEFREAFTTGIRETVSLTLADLFPSSRVLRFFGTAPRKVLACRKRMQRVLEQIIQEKAEAMDGGDDVNEGFVGVLLRLQKERTTLLNHASIVGMLFSMFAGGSETTSATLTWCMTELLRFPAVMAKAQAEVRDAFNGRNKITEQDLARLSYLKLVIKETFRLHIPGPVLIPRVCRETCRIMGYDIPKGMVLFVNVWGICRDPKYWDQPEEFKPERFENNNLDYKGTNYEYLPFGAGRRMCPGITLGVANIELALASLLYHFDWKLPNGMEPKDVDVSEVSGLAASKKTSLILNPIIHVPQANA
ncbi:hypothetical protein ACP4OV_025938 [Aristida adscensionis]